MTSSNALIQDLTVGDLRRKMLRFSFPFMLTNLLQALYNIVDMIIVGRLVGPTGLSAVSMGGLLTTVMLEFAVGISTGGQIYISQLIGAKRNKELNAAIWTIFTMVVALAVIIGGLVYAFHHTLLQLINTPSEVVALAADYLCCCCVGSIFLYGYSAIGAVLRGMGNSSKPLHFSLVATIVNVVLDIVFIAVFDLSVFGAALATVIAQAVAFVCALVYLYRLRASVGLSFRHPLRSFSWKLVAVIARLGLPLTFMQIAIKGSMLFINSFINLFGVAASAVVGVGDKLYSVVSIVTNAQGSAVAATVAQNMGAKKPERARQAVTTAYMINCVFTVFLTILILLFPEGVFRLFTDAPEVITMAPKYLHISLIMYWCFALMSPALGLITGVGNTLLNSFIGILDSVVARIGFSLLLGITFNMGLWGFVLGSSLAGLVTVIIGLAYFLSGRWKSAALLSTSRT